MKFLGRKKVGARTANDVLGVKFSSLVILSTVISLRGFRWSLILLPTVIARFRSRNFTVSGQKNYRKVLDLNGNGGFQQRFLLDLIGNGKSLILFPPTSALYTVCS